MKKIKHPKPLLLSKVELVKFQLKYILEKHNFNSTELLTLSYVYLFGERTPTIMVNNKLSKSEKSIENIISKFRKKGLIQGFKEETMLHPLIKPFIGDLEFTIKLELNEGVDKKL